MDYNYHTHTYHCHHATGGVEEYVQRAIEGGVRYMGFADHAPFLRADGCESKYRVPVAEAKIYCDEIKELAQKYRAEIEIKVGFEMEYYADCFDRMLADAIAWGAEYLILGQHFYQQEIPPVKHAVNGTETAEELEKYVSSVIEAMGKKVFTYVAHPDVLNFIGDPAVYEEQMRKLCIAARETDTPLEINCLGIRDGRHYPNMHFWRIAGEEQAPVVIGFDAHDPESAFDASSLKVAQRMIEEYRLNYIGKPKLILLNELH